jgi:endonuclease G
MKKLFLWVVLFTSSLYAQPYSWVKSVHTPFIVPYDADTTNDYIIVRDQYVVSYNHLKGVPNWVAWQLNQDWFGDVERYSGNFITDNSLPSEFNKIKHDDYTNTGYDRGHLVRSKERTKTVEDNKSTFLLTNIIPQRPDLNRGVWLDFEYHLEDLCKVFGKELYVVAGGVFIKDTTLKNAGKVSIPDSCFKVVFVCDKGSLVPYDTIAVMMPNKDGIRSDDWEIYQTTIDNIEERSGYTIIIKPSSVTEPLHYSEPGRYIYDNEGRAWEADISNKPYIYFQWDGEKWTKQSQR